MEYFKRILHRILFPGPVVVILSVPIAAVLLFCTFAYGEEQSPIAYVAYVISAYSLTIVCACIVRFPKGRFRAALHRNPHIHRYLTDISFKTRVSLYLSLGVNMLFAAMKFFFGIWYRSVWFGTLAVYYTMLAVMRFLLLRHVNRSVIGSDLASELKQYRLCGVILVLMNIALAGVVVLVVQKNEGFHYAGYLIYVVAMYAFYNIITAVRDVIKYREYKSPVMSAAKAIKLAAALVSMLSLETAMLMQFNSRENPEVFRQIMTGTTGGAVCAIVFVMAVFMIIKSTGQLKKMSMKVHELEEIR
ncbi:MAG: hypothetical protein ACI4D3_00245 [Lachnospiraceae bacterium]